MCGGCDFSRKLPLHAAGAGCQVLGTVGPGHARLEWWGRGGRELGLSRHGDGMVRVAGEVGTPLGHAKGSRVGLDCGMVARPRRGEEERGHRGEGWADWDIGIYLVIFYLFLFPLLET